MNYKKRLLALSLLLTVSLCGCGVNDFTKEPESTTQTTMQRPTQAPIQRPTQTPTQAPTQSPTQKELQDPPQIGDITADGLFTERDRKTSYDADLAVKINLFDLKSGSGYSVKGNTLTITEEGEYLLSGTMKGSIVVDASKKDKVRLILNGVTVENESFAPIYIRQADKVFITVLGENTLKNTGEFVQIDDNTVDSAIFSKEDLTINGTGKLTISSTDHGIVSKDDLAIASGTYEINADGNGVSGKDCLKIGGSSIGLNVKGKGLKSDADLTILDGTYVIVSGDDAIHSDTNVTINGGEIAIESSDDGIHASENLTVLGGKIDVKKSYEGLEALRIYIREGNISIVSRDDGMNGAGGKDQSGIGGFGGFGGFGGANSNVLISISGGLVKVNATGDGIDSNGSIEISGGEIYVSGPTDNMNAAFDYDGSASITGGIIVACGAKGMAQNFTTATQGSILTSTSSNVSGEVRLTDASGKVLVSYTPEKTYNSVLVSCPEMKQGETYTIEAGNAKGEITLTTMIVGGGSGFGGGGFNGGGRW